MESITEAWKWAGLVSQMQGAPTIIMSALRPKNSPISSGGYSSGPTSFAKVFDEIADCVLRPGKKNGVTVLFLDADHPDLLEWISPQFKGTLKRCYTGVLFDPNKRYSDELLTQIAHAYNTWSVSFLCKIMYTPDGEKLYPNVCTEIRQKHKGQCILGAIRLNEMHKLTPLQFTRAFKDMAAEMVGYLPISEQNHKERPDLFSFEPQVGLGFVGMANLIGNLGTTYQALVQYWSGVWLTDEEDTPAELIEYLYHDNLQRPSPESHFWLCLVSGIFAGAKVAKESGVSRLWTSQPTAHTSIRLGDIKEVALDRLLEYSDKGYEDLIRERREQFGMKGKITQNQAIQIMQSLGLGLGVVRSITNAVAAEIMPPYAVRRFIGSSAIQQSELTGDTELLYPANVQTRDEVPYETYRAFCQALHTLIDMSECGHTFSHSVYPEVVDLSFVREFLVGPLGSLYYRLPPTKAQTFSKSETWDDVDLTNLFEDEAPQFCPIDGSCEACSM